MSLYLGDQIISGQATLVGESRNIGQIIPSAIPLTDAGLHLLDGSLIHGDGIYSAFVDYIAGLVSTYPNLFVTESAWQTAVSSKGVCDKFVYDSTNNTVRLPKYGTQIITKTSTLSISTASTVPVRGNGMTLGFTNGYNNYGLAPSDNTENSWAYRDSAYGTTLPRNHGRTGNTPGDGRALGITLDGSKSGMVAVTSGVVTANLTDYPLDCYYYIVLATSTKTDIEVDIDEVVTDLNGKADRDLLNLSDTGNIQMAKASMPSDRYIDLTLGASNSIYIAPADGWVCFSKKGTAGQTIILKNKKMRVQTIQSASGENWNGIILPVRKNDDFEVEYTCTGATTIFAFTYAVGSESEAS